LSERSARGYARLSCLTKTMLDEITVVAAQNNDDGSRFIKLGLRPEKMTVTGSIKFDLELSMTMQQQAKELKKIWSKNNRLVLLAASTHPGEDEILLPIFKECKKHFPNVLLVLVPRHPERFNNVYQLCLEHDLKVARRSQTKQMMNDFVYETADVVLGDTMGELMMFYGACDVAFVGGSLVPVGGHNLIEPAVWAKPIICGKHLFNFTEVQNLLVHEHALVVCDDTNELKNAVVDLLQNESKRTTMGAAAQKISNENRGALQKLTKVISAILG